MPWKRKGVCVFKINTDGSLGKKKGCSKSTSKAKKYLKKLNTLDEDRLTYEECGNIIVDIVNETIQNLPVGHKNRNSAFARELLAKIFEALTKEEEISRKNIKKIAFSLSGRLEIL